MILLCQRPAVRLFPPLLVMATVTSLLLFFYSDTRHAGLSLEEADRDGFRSQAPFLTQFLGAGHVTHQHRDVIATSPVTSGRQHVILLSLARSGSSFTADVISHAPTVYYVFEPLKKVEHLYWKRNAGNSSDAKGREALLEWQENQKQRILRNFLSCDFNDLDLSLLPASFLLRGAGTRPLHRCVEMVGQGRAVNMSDCLRQAEQTCQKTHTTLIKVIRLGVRDLLPLMTRDPDLKVILLVRDPRASLWSWINVFNSTRHHSHGQLFETMCHQHLDHDLTTVLQLSPPLRDRVRVLRYETMAEEPLRVSQLLYRYLGLPWSHHVENQIRRQTGSAKQGSKPRAKAERRMKTPLSVVRGDSVQTAQAWRTAVPWPFVQEVQGHCFGVLRRLGYPLFRSEGQLRQLDTPGYRQEEAAVDRGLWLL